MPSLVLGKIFHWKCLFEPNIDKYVIVIGCKKNGNPLFAVATSQQHNRLPTHGCDPKYATYFTIQKTKYDWFPKPTWVIIREIFDITIENFLENVQSGTIQEPNGFPHLSGNTIRGIINCAKKSRDLMPIHKYLLGEGDIR